MGIMKYEVPRPGDQLLAAITQPTRALERSSVAPGFHLQPDAANQIVPVDLLTGRVMPQPSETTISTGNQPLRKQHIAAAAMACLDAPIASFRIGESFPLSAGRTLCIDRQKQMRSQRQKVGTQSHEAVSTTPPFERNTPVGVCRLARHMNVSRWTIQRWRDAGYKFLYGNMTTVEHCKAWREKNADLFARWQDKSEVEKRLREIKGTASGFSRARLKRR
jgi:hypothetical protein